MIAKLSVQSQVDVQNAVELPPVEQVLSVGFDLGELGFVQLLRARLKPTLRRRDGKPLPYEPLAMVAGDAMNCVAFGHDRRWQPSYAVQPVSIHRGSLAASSFRK